MSSTAQILANQQNSLLSTGPCSVSGKIASAKNAISHGLFSTSHPVLPHEDENQFNAILDRYRLDFSPSTGHEDFLVVTMVGARWRIERAGRIENAIIIEEFESPEGKMAQSMMGKGDPLNRIERYRSSIERTYHRCARELQAARKVNIDGYTTQLAENKFNKLVHDYIYAPVPEPEKPSVQNEPNSAPANASRPQPYVRATPKIGRNESCPCGSGLKFKKCCLK